MGDRAIVVLRFPKVYGADLAVYTHWEGSELRARVEAIVASEAFKRRLGDHTYAARILVDQITKPSRDEETGYGVYPLVRGTDPQRFAESTYPIFEVDLDTGEISESVFRPVSAAAVRVDRP